MAIFKRCPTCHQLYEGSACPACSKKFANARSKKRQKENENLKLYGHRRWRRCREQIRAKYFDYDIWMMGIGVIQKCEKPYIHHIIERDENPDLIYDIDNLIPVSFDSHTEIHMAYETDKAGALKRIEAGLRLFKEVFGGD